MGLNIAAPGSGSKITDHQGKILLIEPTAHEQEIPTSFGEKDAIRANVLVVDEEGTEHEVERDVLIFQSKLISQLKGSIGGDLVGGRLTQGTATQAGYSPPWQLEELTAEEIAHAERAVTESDFLV